ncbi:CAP-Gly domain-containing linker protein 1-like [Bactrocera tryoni]|uniref:CAP-Gly domain-containing linker protein 1-like n=1 Tax=Bactrocera tryoni TaxID=59916 RepID=UPI001A96165F|nr:CAP-Gly domain-containing linker protein 1-like [Bactrocera tryoni]
MSKDISNTTGIFNTKLTKQGSPHSVESKLLRFEEIVIPIGKTNGTTPSPTATAKNLNANYSVSKPRQTNKEYMTTQKVYDVLKEPEDYKPLKSSLSLKPINMKYTAVPLVGNKMIHISFPTFINAMLKEQLPTTSNEAAFRSKPTVTVKLPTKDASPAAATPVLVDDTTKTTNTTIPTIMRPTAVVSTANPTELTESLKNSKIDVSASQPPKATATTTDYEKNIIVTTTAETEIESFNSNTTSTSSLEISAVDINGKVSTNTASITAPSASTTKSIACKNITQKLTFNKKSVMRSVHIPLSIASEAHKTLAFTGPKMPIRPLVKSRNCVLLSTKSNTTAKDKGIIKFIPKSPWPKKYVADECDVSNPTDSNSNDALISKDAEKFPAAGKEVLVITTDIDTKKTAVNIPIVPLVGKRKYTDPAMMPILSFSYQKSLSDYIRKAKEFHKRAKICATAALATIDNSKINEVESAKNFISTDSDGSGNKDNTNMKCDHESNLKQGDSTAERRKEVTAMEVEETANGESENKENSTDMEITEKIGSIKYVKSTIKDIHNLKDMETVEKLENVRTTSLDNLKYLKALTDVKSASSIDNLTNMKSAESPKNSEDNESGENTDDLKKEESANGTKETENIESTERTNNSREKETAEGIKDLKDIESAENRDLLKDLKSGEDTNGLKDVRSVNGTKIREDIESLEHTNNSKEMETPEGIKNLKDTEVSENKDHPNDLEDIENLKDMKSTESANNLKYGKSAENTEKLEDIDRKILKDLESTGVTEILKNMESTERRKTPKGLKDNLKVKESVEYTDNLKEVESAERTQNRKNVESTGNTDSQEEVKSTRATVNLKDIEAVEGTESLKELESTESIKILHGIESAKCAYKPDLKSAQKTKNRSHFESAESIHGIQDLESTESTKFLKVLNLTESAENLKVVESIERAKNPKDIKSADDSNNANNIESAEVKEMRQDKECVDNRKNIATTAEMSNQIDIESDLFTYEIFNNVSGINNASSRNEQTQTKDSTIKILKNIFELKEKVQQQAEEIMSLKAAMKLLKTPNMLNRP